MDKWNIFHGGPNINKNASISKRDNPTWLSWIDVSKSTCGPLRRIISNHHESMHIIYWLLTILIFNYRFRDTPFPESDMVYLLYRSFFYWWGIHHDYFFYSVKQDITKLCGINSRITVDSGWVVWISITWWAVWDALSGLIRCIGSILFRKYAQNAMLKLTKWKTPSRLAGSAS